MPRKKTKIENPQAHLYGTLFTLIERDGWWGLTLPKIARAAKIPLAEVLKTYADKNALLESFPAFIDGQLADIDLSDANTPKERLFEILMRRFELLQPYRAGIARMEEDALRHPASALCMGLGMAPAARRSLKRMMELAELAPRPPLHEIALIGLKLVYVQAVCVWRKDASADLASTMAALDRGLDKFISFLRLG